MKITKKFTTYFFSFAPILVIFGFSQFNSIKISHSKFNKKVDDTWDLPCNYPNKGIVSGGAPTFYTSSTVPILVYEGQTTNPAYPGVPSSVSVGNVQLVLQNDGNLVIYENGKACWDTGTNGKGGPGYTLWFQPDGNLVLRNGFSYNSQSLWSSNIYSNCGNDLAQYAYFTLQSDGNFVMRFPRETDGLLSIRSHINYYSYALGDTHSENGNHNTNHKIQ